MTATSPANQSLPQKAKKGPAAPVPVIEKTTSSSTSSEYKAFVGSLQLCDMKDFNGIRYLRSSSGFLMANQRHRLIQEVGCLHGNTLIQRALAEKNSTLYESYHQELQILIKAGQWKEIPKAVDEILVGQLSSTEFLSLWDFGVQGYSRILAAEMSKAIEAGDKQQIINLSLHPLKGQLPLEDETALENMSSKGLFRIYKRQIQEAQATGNKKLIFEAMDRTMAGFIQSPEVDQLQIMLVKGIGKIYKKEMLDAVQGGDKAAILKAYEGVVVGLVQDKDIEQMRSLATYGLRKLGEEELAKLIEDPDISKITKFIRKDFNPGPPLTEFSAETDRWIRQQLPELFPPAETVGPQSVEPQPTGQPPAKKPLKKQPGQPEEKMPKRTIKPSVEIKPYGSGRVGVLVDGIPIFWGGFYSPLPEEPIQIKSEKWDKDSNDFILSLTIWFDYAILQFVQGYEKETHKMGFNLWINLFAQNPGEEKETPIILFGDTPILRPRRQQLELPAKKTRK